MKKLLASILAAGVILTSMAACSGETTPSSSKAEAPSSAQQSSSTATSSTASGGETSAEPIEYTLFVDHDWFWFDKWGTDPVSQKITELTGVSFDMTRATDGQQLALLIATDDLPDFVYTATTSTIGLLSDPNECYSYNELVEKTGVDIHATESEILNNTRSDGNYYCLLNAYTSQEAIDEGNTLLSGGTQAIAYRTDIWEEIGSPEFNSIEDLENALIAAKEKHPDIIPLLPSNGYMWYFAEQMGLNGSSTVGYDKDGKPCYFLNEDGIYDYFKLINRFAREGLINAESMTYSYDKFCEVRNSGNTFMQLRSTDEAQASNSAAISAGTDYRWKLLTNELSEEALVNVNTGIGWSGTFITKNNKDPERAIEFMSWARSEEGRKLCSWGIEGEHWEYNENGETVTTKAYQDALANGKLKQDDFGVAVWIFGDQGDENAFIDHGVTDPDAQDCIARLQSAVKHTKVMSELYFCIPTEGDELNIYNSLNDMYNSEINKIIFAESEEACDAAIDSLYEQAEALGLSKLNQWMEVQLENHLSQAK